MAEPPLEFKTKFGNIWALFISRCKEVNGIRQNEDRVGHDNRKAELDFLSSLKTPEGNAAWQRAFEEDKRLSAVCAKRNEADSIIIQALFNAMVKNAWNLAAEPNGPPPLITLDTFGITHGVHVALAPYANDNLGFQGMGLSSSCRVVANPIAVDPALQALSPVPFPSSTVNAAGSASQSSSSQPASIPRADKAKTSNKRKAGALEEPETGPTARMADLTLDDSIVNFPHNSVKFWVMTCPLCGRNFQSAHGLYGHLAQSDEEHLAVFGGEKTFNKAVAICGTRIIDADKASAEAHNKAAMKKLMGRPGKDGI
ncbi:uncharacterized protein LY89DRAFT_391556 [Mollisia scopiformis]|uniref:C2H2-type domain-containing protein n=1 Tax=Mollisia scopiformis TaxID=149040 RepID=A0A194XPB4_MOLSC|nr:uncharacterized protein LY89DRAFT_391556 [Mollisia scopiformis]KUJ22028.1 hypothetical protein LY89DRAFT_391556 [Mollisia scopiformis]